ncbi:Heat shock protein ssb1 [Entomophthora muscae]|uniref:Heat shock protein ssb1 n=1 Tax=Entomophthora muscae TaxID=34485 RepID=A0ACC2SGR3_9FUNG|nr:Heat shock protein ssb1 [Entomophthora muscae]
MVLALSFGGGVVDASLITIKENNFFVNAAAGDSFLGGVDFDDALVQYCQDDFKGRYNKDISGEWRALSRLRAACEEAKCALSSSTETDIHVNDLHEGIDYSYRLTREKFEEISKRIFIKIMGVIRALFSRRKLKALKYSKEDVDEVIVVGGSSNIPKIQSDIKRLFEKEIKFLDEGSVAYGTAVLVAHHAGILGAHNFSLRDVASSNCCIKHPNNSTELFFRSKTSLPIKTSRRFKTSTDGSTTNFSLFECDRNQNTYGYNLICNVALFDRDQGGQSKDFNCLFEMKMHEGIIITPYEADPITYDVSFDKEIDCSFSGPGFLPTNYNCPLSELLSGLQVKS